VLTKLLQALLGVTLGNLVYLAACLVPRDRKLWLFGAWNGRKYLDNPKYVFRFVREHASEIRAVWICKDRKLCMELRQAGLPAEYCYGFRGAICQLRAGLAVYTHSASWEFAPFLLGHRVLRVQTWHGIPIKKIGYDDERSGNAHRRAALTRFVFRYDDDRHDLVIAASEEEKRRYKTAFNVNEKDIRVTGSPRNDALLQSARRHDLSPRSRKKAIYMPTYRGNVGSEFQLFAESSFDFAAADRACEIMGVDLYVKLHPVQSFRADDRKALDRARVLHAIDGVGDIYERIGEFDILITDFSGIYFDFLITGRPIVMAPIHFERYLAQDRSLYYSYYELCPDEPCHTWADVLHRLQTLAAVTFVPGERYRKLQQQFHRYLDDGAAGRVTAELLLLSGAESGRDPRAPSARVGAGCKESPSAAVSGRQ
jgi:CDP-glycerol glycerophosphotransferase